jgi:hypothetical protein
VPTPAAMPKTIKVGPHVYSVLRKSAPGELGNCNFTLLQICIKPRLRRSKAREILLHEVLHATTHPSMNGDKKYTDEDFVTAVSPMLLEVLRDNPGLLEYLVG